MNSFPLVGGFYLKVRSSMLSLILSLVQLAVFFIFVLNEDPEWRLKTALVSQVVWGALVACEHIQTLK